MDVRTALPFGRWSATTRLVTLVFALQILLSGLVLFYVYAATTREVEGQERAIVTELHDDLVAGFQSGGEAELARLIAARLEGQRGADVVVVLTASDGRVVAGNLRAWPAGIAMGTSWRIVELSPIGHDHPHRIGVVVTALPGGLRLLAGRAVDNNLRLIRINARAMVAALVIAMPLALALSVLLGRVVNARLRAVSATAEAVANGDLSHRVTRDGSHDAFDRLAGAVNMMLERVDRLVGELRIVTDGLAHDLRSPLTRLKSTLERARSETRDPAALVALDTVAAEADQVLAMLTMALQISRAEAGIGRDRFVETDVDALIEDVVEVFGPVAEDQGVRLEATGTPAGCARLHRDLVQQALSNLVENALHYAEGATRITVSAQRIIQDVPGITLVVADDGPGIPADRRDEALRRFARLDPSRHSAGAGLGLALVEAVARLHGGSLVLDDNRPGLRVTLFLAD